MKEMLKNNPEEGCFFIKRNPKNKGFAYPADPYETHDDRNRAFKILYLTTDMLTLLPDTVNLAKSCVSITGVTALLSIVMFVKAVEKFDLM